MKRQVWSSIEAYVLVHDMCHYMTHRQQKSSCIKHSWFRGSPLAMCHSVTYPRHNAGLGHATLTLRIFVHHIAPLFWVSPYFRYATSAEKWSSSLVGPMQLAWICQVARWCLMGRSILMFEYTPMVQKRKEEQCCASLTGRRNRGRWKDTLSLPSS
jgi:hypothetical protein